MIAKKIVMPNGILLDEVCRILSEGQGVVLMTKGSSMLPFIIGERDSVELFKPVSLSVGDIVLARLAEGHYVLHRIYAVSDCITLKGDGNLDCTESCRPEDVCGVVKAIIRNGDRRIDCTDSRFVAAARVWRNAPRLVRRLVLAIYRRLI